MGSNPKIGVFIKRRNSNTEMGRMPSENRGRHWSDASTRQGMSRTTSDHQKRQGSVLPQSLWGDMVLVTSWFQISSLHNCEKANFCCFKLTVCGNVLQHSWETNALPLTHIHTHYIQPSAWVSTITDRSVMRAEDGSAKIGRTSFFTGLPYS